MSALPGKESAGEGGSSEKALRNSVSNCSARRLLRKTATLRLIEFSDAFARHFPIRLVSMSFFNPFRKNNRPQGVKLSELNQESASGENAGGNPPERREPSFGGASGEASVPPAFAPSDANPPAFTFAEPESEGPRVQPVPQPVPPESPKMPAAEAKKPAPWDPYGIETVKNEPVMGSEPTAAQEKPVEPVFQTPQPEPVPSVQPVQPVSTISSASSCGAGINFNASATSIPM